MNVSAASSSSSSSSHDPIASLENMLQAAFALYSNGNHNGALTALHNAALSYPLEPSPPFYIGSLHQAVNNFEETQHYLLATLALNSAHTDALNNLGKLYSDTGNKEQATYYYQSAIASNEENSAQSRINLGLSFHADKRYDEAIAVYHGGLQHRTDKADELFYNMAGE
jgi:tetratricopeptide (TPR) repeat protein